MPSGPQAPPWRRSKSLRPSPSSIRTGRGCASASTVGEAVVGEIGGEGHVAYPLVGDTINTGSRLESVAPVGGVLIGAETFEKLPKGAVGGEKGGQTSRGR